MSRHLVFEAEVSGHVRTFAVAADLLSMAPEESASATLQRHIFGLRDRLEQAASRAPESGMIYLD